MKVITNAVMTCSYDDSAELEGALARLSSVVRDNPWVLAPFQDRDERAGRVLAAAGFELYATVKGTTLFYDAAPDCFFKILHPLNLKKKMRFLLVHRARQIHDTVEYLISRGVKVLPVRAYGMFTQGRLPFFAVKKAEGASLYDILIRRGGELSPDMERCVMDELVKLHRLGYWLGDAHLAHIFITEQGISGFIDMDGIRKNRPWSVRNLARDLAGLNHPRLPLTGDEKKGLLEYYSENMKIEDRKNFLRQVKHFTERRWKD
ncbi:MAG: hypothetical protein JSU90_08515 [Nitrospiraceae bacterium]|nr:MAG: hypothetical protein JSU90_08515 [Nitrospiraceae bacterium]